MFVKRLPVTFGDALLILIAGASLFASSQDSVRHRRRLIGEVPRRLDADPKTIHFKSNLPMHAVGYVSASASAMSPDTSSNMTSNMGSDMAPDMVSSPESAPILVPLLPSQVVEDTGLRKMTSTVRPKHLITGCVRATFQY
jgi:hypothetical protein